MCVCVCVCVYIMGSKCSLKDCNTQGAICEKNRGGDAFEFFYEMFLIRQ